MTISIDTLLHNDYFNKLLKILGSRWLQWVSFWQPVHDVLVSHEVATEISYTLLYDENLTILAYFEGSLYMEDLQYPSVHNI